jgi:uncharacterized membrane protein
MADREEFGIASTAQVRGHPIHPMLVPIPITALILTFVADLAFWWTGSWFWAEAGFWLLAVAVLGGLAAAVAGFVDFIGDGRIQALSHAWQHMLGNAVAMVIAVVNLGIRLDADPAILPWGLLLSAATVAIIAFTGWLGGEMVYRKGVGVSRE